MSVPTVPQRAYVEPERERPKTIWTGGKVLVLFIVWLLAAVPPAIVAILVSGGDAEETLSSIPFLFATLLVQAIATIVAAVLIARAAGGRFGPSIGFRFEISDLVGILLGVALQIGVAIVLAPIALLTDTEETEQAVGDLIGTGEGVTEVTLIVLSVAVLAPLVEEILFRGVLIQWLLSKVNKVWVILFSGVAFGLAHFLPEPFGMAAHDRTCPCGVRARMDGRQTAEDWHGRDDACRRQSPGGSADSVRGRGDAVPRGPPGNRRVGDLTLLGLGLPGRPMNLFSRELVRDMNEPEIGAGEMGRGVLEAPSIECDLPRLWLRCLPWPWVPASGGVPGLLHLCPSSPSQGASPNRRPRPGSRCTLQGRYAGPALWRSRRTPESPMRLPQPAVPSPTLNLAG